MNTTQASLSYLPLMDDVTATILIFAGTGAGALGGVLLKGHYDSQTFLKNERKAFIKKCREEISKIDFDSPHFDFVDTDLYLWMRPFLTDEFIKEVEPDGESIKYYSPIGRRINSYKIELSEALFKLETEWKLI